METKKKKRKDVTTNEMQKKGGSNKEDVTGISRSEFPVSSILEPDSIFRKKC